MASIKYEVGRVLARRPGLYFAVHNLIPRSRPLIWRSDTEIVIDGYPRSANTFFCYAFEKMQGREIRLAHHSHSQSQIIRAVNNSTPTCVLIRNPEDAVKSLLIRRSNLSGSQALRGYCQFYEDIIEYSSGFYLATFEQITNNYADAIIGINNKFGTDFGLPGDSEDPEEEMLEQVRDRTKDVHKGRETMVAVPSQQRAEIKKQIQLDPDELKLALSVYHRVLDLQ